MAWLTTIILSLLLAAIATTLTVLRVRFVTNPQREKPLRHGRRNPHEPTHLLIVLGSGGHTAEMMAMLERAVHDPDPTRLLDWKDYTHRTWIVSAGDALSAQRAKDFEEMATALSTQERLMHGNVRKATDRGPGTYDIHVVPRAREIHQPLWTAPISSLRCFWASWNAIVTASTTAERDFPDLVLVNGPATATIVVFTTILLRFFNVQGCFTRFRLRTIYIESWARVKKPSLSGVLLARVVDRFLVQWPQLKEATGGRAQYLGVFV